MLKTLILYIWSKIYCMLFWPFGIDHRLPRKPKCTDRERLTISTNPQNNSKSNLKNLPDELLLNIFDRVPVHDLICKIPRICSRFALLRSAAYNRRQHLKIIWADDTKSFMHKQDNNNICNTLKFGTISQLNVQNCTKIISTFPNVRSLQLNSSCVTVSQLNESIIDILLSRLYHQLEALHLELTFEFDVFSRANTQRTEEIREQMRNAGIGGIERAFRLINQMSLLKRLTLCTSNAFPELPELTIIAQLNEFYIFSHECVNRQFESLVNCDSIQLKRIGIGIQTLVDNAPLVRGIHTRKTRALLSKITHFSLAIGDSQTEPNDTFRDLLLCMPNLCKLSISWPSERPFVELIRALEPVTQVTHSKLVALFLTIAKFDDEVEGNDELVYDNEIPLDHRPSIELPSIQHLQIACDTPSHRSYQLLHLDTLFPNLRTIYCENTVSSCSICGIGHFGYYYEHWWYRRKRSKCINLMVQCLQQMLTKPEIIFTYTSRPSYKDVDLYF